QKTGIESFEVFTTRCDTLFGVTYCAIAPEHPLVDALLEKGLLDSEQKQKIQDVRKFPSKERSMMEKEGFDLGITAIHPLSGVEIPIWVANFVLIEYANGAVMAVPAHDERDFEFAKKYNLPIKPVLVSSTDSLPFCEDGELIESGIFNGLKGATAREKIIAYFEEHGRGVGVINYRLRDWGVSRQRYWGAPIPMVHCQKCGIVPEKIENLPVLLPDDVVINGEGNPLDKHPAWKECQCPKCGGNAQRETDTMDTFVQSSWYFLRYATPKQYWEQCAFRAEDIAYWMNVDEYIGGIEHAILHLLYARFFTKVLRDLGYVNLNEPFANLLT
ncbi:class I tRNA ligase family protein, partial [Helicobacter equorum]